MATARVYRFASADFPGAEFSRIFDKNNATIVGDFSYGTTSFETPFTLQGNSYEILSIPGSVPAGSLLTGINTSGVMVGSYIDTSDVYHGFLDNAGVFTNIDDPNGITIPYGINDSGEIVGDYVDSSVVTHGFYTLDGVTFTTIDFPGCISTIAAGVNSAGVITGQWTDATSSIHGFIYSGGVFTQLDFPLATNTTPIGINDSKEIAGYYVDATGIHGFIYSKGAFSRVDVAGATGTQLTRIKNGGQITGVFIDSVGEIHGVVGR